MSHRSTLQVAPREASSTRAAGRLRREGLVPAVIYGKKYDAANLKVDAKALRDLLSHSTSEHILVNLDIEGKGAQLALIQDVQHNALTGGIVHVDFHAVREDEKLHAKVPVLLTGESAGVKLGGLLEHLVHSIDIECLPKDLPETITVDITNLEVGQSIHVKEIGLPSGVTTRLGGDVVVVLLAEPKVSEEPKAAAAAAAAPAKK